jgi:hypothetical protein
MMSRAGSMGRFVRAGFPVHTFIAAMRVSSLALPAFF